MSVVASNHSTAPTAPSTSTADAGRADQEEVPRRLVVEMSRQSAQDLGEMVTVEELNKTTVINRAIQLYALVRRTLNDGGKVYIQEPGSDEIQRIRLL